MAPDDIFIRSLETHLAWPIDATRALLAERTTASRPFDAKLQEWMTAQGLTYVRNNPDQWAQALDRASQTLVHVLANRLIFYQALRARFPKLPQLRLRGVKTAAEAYAYLQRVFDSATRASGIHHEAVNHSQGEYVRGNVHTNSIEYMILGRWRT